jgi:hypothetical protein
MNFSTNSRVRLFVLASFVAGAACADTYTVGAASCSNTQSGKSLAICQATGASIALNQNTATATSQSLSLVWSASGVAVNFGYRISVASLSPGTYNVSTPAGAFLVSTVNGFLNYSYSFTTASSGSGVIAITPAGKIASATAAATFTGSDASTEGSWNGKYGGAGYLIAGDAMQLPVYANVSMSGATLLTWANPTTDMRGLEDFNATTTQRTAAAWSNTGSFSIALNLTDGNAHSVSLYLLDWTGGRNQGVRITDAASGATLDQEYLNSFTFGHYWTWTLQGNVILTVVNNGGSNAVASGLFLNN